MTKKLYPNVLAISETKIDTSSPNAMFTIDEYYNPADFRKDRDGNGGGLLIYIKKALLANDLKPTRKQILKVYALKSQLNQESGLFWPSTDPQIMKIYIRFSTT